MFFLAFQITHSSYGKLNVAILGPSITKQSKPNYGKNNMQSHESGGF